MEYDIKNEDKPTMQWVCRYLLSGKAIYFSDNIQSRMGNYISTINQGQIHEFGKSLYEFVKENYMFLKNFIELCGFSLFRESHSNLSINPDYQYFYYIEPLNYQDISKIERFKSLNKGDILILSALILETNTGAFYIDLKKDFIEKIIQDPKNILNINIDFKDLIAIISPRSKIKPRITKTEDFLKKRILEKISLLRKYNFIHIVQNNQKVDLVSIGPMSFRFIKLLRELKSKKQNDEVIKSAN